MGSDGPLLKNSARWLCLSTAFPSNRPGKEAGTMNSSSVDVGLGNLCL